MTTKKITLGIVDDHILLRKGLASLIMNYSTHSTNKYEYKLELEADNGREMIEKIGANKAPDVILLDTMMPVMDGYESALWLKKNHPHTKVLAISTFDSESSIIRMIKNGASGYLFLDALPEELMEAINTVVEKGFYHTELVTRKLIHAVRNLDNNEEIKPIIQLNDKEIEILKLFATELTLKEIAERMFLSPRTIDGYRDALFEKLNVKTRVGLVMYAIKNGIVST